MNVPTAPSWVSPSDKKGGMDNVVTDLRIPATVITGFLGAGKTTLLNRLLRNQAGRKIAVIVNEFGEVGIDGQLIFDDGNEQLIEFNNGCLCCTVRGDLIETLERIRERAPDLDAIMIETTGLADPAPVASTFFVSEEVKSAARLDAFITVIDAVNFERSLDENEEAREQLSFADIVLVNKIDLVSEEDLRGIENRIRRLNPLAKTYRTSQADVDPSLVIGTNAFQLAAKLEVDPLFLDEHPHEHDASIGSIVLREQRPIDMNRFMAWISGLLQVQGGTILRSKGVFNAMGFNERVLFQSVRMLTTINRLDAWGEAARTTEYVVIGRNLDCGMLEEGFFACVRC
jgi:G3E family GTPase